LAQVRSCSVLALPQRFPIIPAMACTEVTWPSVLRAIAALDRRLCRRLEALEVTVFGDEGAGTVDNETAAEATEGKSGAIRWPDTPTAEPPEASPSHSIMDDVWQEQISALLRLEETTAGHQEQMRTLRALEDSRFAQLQMEGSALSESINDLFIAIHRETDMREKQVDRMKSEMMHHRHVTEKLQQQLDALVAGAADGTLGGSWTNNSNCADASKDSSVNSNDMMLQIMRLVVEQLYGTPNSKGNASKADLCNQEVWKPLFDQASEARQNECEKGTPEEAAARRFCNLVTGLDDPVDKTGLTPSASTPRVKFATGLDDPINKMGLMPSASTPRGIAHMSRQRLQPKVGRLVRRFGGTCGVKSLPPEDAAFEWACHTNRRTSTITGDGSNGCHVELSP